MTEPQEKDYREILAPRTLKEGDESFHSVEELEYAVSQPECLNIALTGNYGSGKSSVINTFLSRLEKKKVLKVSLSTFMQGGKGEDENEVESKIFQYILYTSNAKNTPQTGFRRILHLSNKEALCIVGQIVLFLISFIIVFEPVSLQIPAFYALYDKCLPGICGHRVDRVSDIFFTIIMVILLCYWCVELVRRSSRIGIGRLKLKDFEVEAKNEVSVFNQWLDEMLYFIKANKYDYVVFEDLDRLKEPRGLFLKFREINLMLNTSDYFKEKHKAIRFIYSIRDDVFQEEMRTKCFDYIVPVVPKVDRFNAADYIAENYKDVISGIDIKDIEGMASYIDGMRELYNIMNEYMLYRKVVLKEMMSGTKLLAIIIYKNLFPEDYALAHHKEGCLADVFDHKKDFTSLLTKDDDDKLSSLNESIAKAHEGIVKIRTGALDWLRNNYHVDLLYDDVSYYTLDEVAEKDELYRKYEHDQFDKYQYTDDDERGTLSYNFKFRNIINNLESDNDYDGRMSLVEGQLYDMIKSRDKILRHKRQIEDRSLQKIIRIIDNSDQSLRIVEEICQRSQKNDDKEPIPTQLPYILHLFIRNGYIAEDYSDYMSFSYEGTLTSSDREYQHAVLQGTEQEYDKKIDHPDSILAKLQHENKIHRSILNFTMLEYLLDAGNNEDMDCFIEAARSTPKFVTAYYREENHKEVFFQRLFSGWNHCIDAINAKADNQEREVMLEIFFKVAPTDINLNNKEIEQLNDLYPFLDGTRGKLDKNKVIELVNHFNLIFTSLVDSKSLTNPIFGFVVTNGRFVISTDNLRVIYGSDFDVRSYSRIMEGVKEILNYLNNNIKATYAAIPVSDNKESESAIRALVGFEQLSVEQLSPFVERQELVLQEWGNLRKDCIPLFIKADKIEATWANVKVAYVQMTEKKDVLDFVIRHTDELAEQKAEDEEMKLQRWLLGDNETLSDEQFGKIAPCFDEAFEADEVKTLSDYRLSQLIRANLIGYSEEFSAFFAEKTSRLFAEYLINFFDEVIADENFSHIINNAVGIVILGSQLALSQKVTFLNSLAVLYDEADEERYAHMIVSCYNEYGVDEKSDINLIVDALGVDKATESWYVKISLINKVNKAWPYDKEREESMLKSLGGEYLKLNELFGTAHFDDNEVNNTLLGFLQEKGHYVNKVYPPVGGQIKVTFKSKM